MKNTVITHRVREHVFHLHDDLEAGFWHRERYTMFHNDNILFVRELDFKSAEYAFYREVGYAISRRQNENRQTNSWCY